MTTLEEGITMYAAEMRRAQFSTNSQARYATELRRFAKHVGEDTTLADIGAAECRSFIDTFDHHAPSTVALEQTIMSSFFKFAVLDDLMPVNPMDRLRRPKVPALRDRERTRVTTDQVEQMLAACETWPERICLHTLAYLGVRRTALSNLRWGDVDGKQWTATFMEKGSKRIAKPVPLELRRLWTAYAIECGPFDVDDWVVPARRDTGRRDQRSSRLIYHLVKTVAARCGINAHVHSFRAAFAVHFLQSNPAQLEALRQLMGHTSISTTQGYLDELEGQAAMRVVETLSFAKVVVDESELAVSA